MKAPSLSESMPWMGKGSCPVWLPGPQGPGPGPWPAGVRPSLRVWPAGADAGGYQVDIQVARRRLVPIVVGAYRRPASHGLAAFPTAATVNFREL